jgi:hypothetical protein
LQGTYNVIGNFYLKGGDEREFFLPDFHWSPEPARGSCDGERGTDRVETERVRELRLREFQLLRQRELRSREFQLLRQRELRPRE